MRIINEIRSKHDTLWEHRYSSEEYISLLNTHSKHRQLNEETRQLLFCGIKEIIDYHSGILRPLALDYAEDIYDRWISDSEVS